MRVNFRSSNDQNSQNDQKGQNDKTAFCQSNYHDEEAHVDALRNITFVIMICRFFHFK